MDEISDITDFIQEEAGDTADVIWGHGYDEDLGEKLCVTIIATGFKTTPHTGLPIRENFKKHDLGDERPTIITKQIDSPVNTSTESEVTDNNIEAPIINNNPDQDSSVKRYILEDDESASVDAVKEEKNAEIVNQETVVQPSVEMEKNDGKIRFLLEEDEEEVEDLEENIVSSDDNITIKNNLIESENKAEEKVIEPKEISEERLERIRKATQKLRSPLGLNEMEDEPAYKRRNIELDDVKQSSDPSISRYTLWENEDDNGDKQTGLSDNNSFLHDNVD
jgi:cell division protein FtsZ